MIFPQPNGEIKLEEEAHKYILTGHEDIEFTSVTTCISEFFDKFDKEAVAYKLVTTIPKYKGRSAEDRIKEWDIKLKKDPEIDRAIAGVNWLNKYLQKSDYDIFSEVIVYCKELKIAGTVDLLVFDNESQKYSILDWKTSKAIKTDSYKMKTGNKPETNDLLDCKFNHYTLQLSLYRYLLEKNYNIQLDDQLIIHLDTNTVHGYLTPYFKEHIVSILKHY
jgi:ATP-dependent exoDNAse (exonuclease V) beta subunit